MVSPKTRILHHEKSPARKTRSPVQVEKVSSLPPHYSYGVGRRKEARATVKVYSESGPIVVNGKRVEEFFPSQLHEVVSSPLSLLGLVATHRVEARVSGGGVRGQAEAVRLGIARALLEEDSTWKKSLRSNGLVTRDPRAKERKKYGLKRARRAPQWTKR